MSCGCGRSPDFCRGWHSLSEEEWQKELTQWQTLNEYDKPAANQHTVEVTEVHHYTDKLFRFETTKPKGYLFKAGEFVMIGLGDKTKRAYSITSSPTDDFLEFSKSKGNDLTTPRPEFNFPGLKEGDRWCLCALRWKEAYDAGVAPKVHLESCHLNSLNFVTKEQLEEHAVNRLN